MNRISTWLSSTFTQTAVKFVGSVVIGFVLKAMLDNVISVLVGAVEVIIVFFIVFSVAVVASLRKEISSGLLQSRLSTRIYYATNVPGGDLALYDAIIESISSANESIRVVSLFRSPTLKSSPAREKYYRELNKILETKHRRGERFRYERILQVKEVLPGKIGPDQTDLVTYEHCKLVTELQKSQTALTIRLRQVPDILSTISFVIVDDREVMLAIPSVTRTEDEQLEASRLGTIVFFTDPDGSLTREMRHLFDNLLLDADHVSSVIPSRNMH